MTEDRNKTPEEKAAEAAAIKLTKVLGQVRKLMERATHGGTTPEEAKACEEKADALMLQYSIDAAMIDASMPAAERRKPISKTIVVCKMGNPAHRYLMHLATTIGHYCRVRVVFLDYGLRRDKDAEIKAGAYGYQSDVAFFDLMLTTLFLHLGSQLYPKWATEKDEAENIVRLHHQGLNWLDIAKIHPGVKWQGRDKDSRPDTLVGSRIKRTYYSWCDAQKPPVTPKIMPNRIQYLKSFSEAYHIRIAVRFDELMSNRAAGTALVLANGEKELEDYLRSLFGELQMITTEHIGKRDPDAYAAGTRAADEADLSGGRGHVRQEARTEVRAEGPKELS